MKNQALFSSKDKSKKLICRLLQFLFGPLRVKTLTSKKQTTKFSSTTFPKMLSPKLYHIENSKTRGQTT